jgi:hypothetical protein
MKRTSSQAGRKAKNHGRARLDALIEEATVDCWGQEEQRTGLLTMIEDQVVCPFRAKVIGEEVTVLEFELTEHGCGLLAVCERKGKKYRVDLNSLEWVKPLPAGFEWIEAFQAWQSMN